MIFEIARRFMEKYKILMLLLAIFIAYYVIRISEISPYFLLFIVAIPFVSLLLESKEIGFYLILIWVFFADWFVQLAIIPTQLSWLPEIVLVIYTLSFFYKKKSFVRTPIDIPILLFMIISVISAIYNARHPFSVLLALRLDLRFILMFYLLISSNLRENFYRTMIKTFLFLLVVQIPTALIKYTIYGQGEMAIGTYAAWGGTYSTFLPLIAISLSISKYLHEKKPHLIYLTLIFGFIVFSIVGGKKGLIFYGPMLVLFIILKQMVSNSTRRRLYRALPIGIVILVMFVPIVYFVPWLKPAARNPEYLKEFISIYDLQYTPSGNPAGRIPSIITTFKTLAYDPMRFMIGYGPGTMIKSYFEQFDTRERRTQPIWSECGVTELVQKPVEYGYIGFLIYFLVPMFLIFCMNESFYRKISNNYWKTISFGFAGIIFAYFVISIAYSAVMRRDLAGFIFWFFAAAIYQKGKKERIL